MTAFSEPFEELAADHAASAIENVMMFNTHVPTGAAWSLDLAAQQVTFGDMTVNAVPVGTFSESYRCWVWAWGNPSFQEGDPALTASLRLRTYGERHGIPEFTDRQVALDQFSDLRVGAEKLALISTGLLGGNGYAGVTINDFRLYLVSDDPSVPRLTNRAPDQIEQVLRNAERWVEADPRDIAVGYVTQLGGKYQQIPGGLAISLPDGPAATLIYSANGLVRVDPPMIPLL